MGSEGLQTVVAVALNFVPGCQVWCSALFSAQVNYYHTGNVGSALRAGATSAAIAGVFYGIGQGAVALDAVGSPLHIAAHAVAGGIIADVQGGNFGHGFWSAGLTKAANVNGMISSAGVEYDIARVAVAAAIGGTISELTGGKFANGAITAAYAQAYNGNKALKRAAKKLSNLRRKAVRDAWKDEIKLVKETGEGTREWTKAELELLKNGKIPKGYHGHHVNSVNGSPDLAGEPNNIIFLTPDEHFAAHSRNWQTPTVGSLLDRSVNLALGIGISALEIMDAYSFEGIIGAGARAGCAAGDANMCNSYQIMGGEVRHPDET
ncbi:hypothetical protein N474_25255 [Pseudoalteromonas luteoviolacea CPMOR-2]|nr:hypothetical protein N474_25255 [Pseudoalteromonas luteoviolacea CPMOR-2]